jgi:hypothetical protein
MRLESSDTGGVILTGLRYSICQSCVRVRRPGGGRYQHIAHKQQQIRTTRRQ